MKPPMHPFFRGLLFAIVTSTVWWAVFILLFLRGCAAEIDPAYKERIVDAIYWAEGGPKAKAPYGILSIPVRDAAHARRICSNTVQNNWRRWQDAGRPGEFIKFLGLRYCPPSADPVGHENWVRNVTAQLRKKK